HYCIPRSQNFIIKTGFFSFFSNLKKYLFKLLFLFLQLFKRKTKFRSYYFKGFLLNQHIISVFPITKIINAEYSRKQFKIIFENSLQFFFFPNVKSSLFFFSVFI